MAIRDNLKTGGSSKKLYDALEYSGIVTENMSFDDMCAALSEYFPGMLQVVSNSLPQEGFTFVHSTNKSSTNPNPDYYTISSTMDANYLKMYTEVIAYDNKALKAVGSLSITINKRAFKKLQLTFKGSNISSGSQNYISLYINDAWLDGTHTNTAKTFTFNRDLSAYATNEKITIKIECISEIVASGTPNTRSTCTTEIVNMILTS